MGFTISKSLSSAAILGDESAPANPHSQRERCSGVTEHAKKLANLAFHSNPSASLLQRGETAAV